MEQQTDYLTEVEEVEKAVRQILDNSDFRYISVRFALEELIQQYDTASKKYSKQGIMKDISKYAD